ncbi:MAG: protein-L-isoaspartate(D-aspartate) O-methyltransferase [Candidatus Omnitrophota bacterium]|nr:protein-L-isoaspartate(D-aspartate) O-methyltransferase [Candidatus Omnitrophota bacterium]
MKPDQYERLREEMVARQIIARGITDERVCAAFRHVPRHLFVPQVQRPLAYEDYPLSIGHGQTISQPYIVALMIEALSVASGDRVLEIGTGSGYQTALLAELGVVVYSVERIGHLAQSAAVVLGELGYRVIIETADGTLGWPAQAPYDKIIVTAAAPMIPDAWSDQLVIGGRMVIPVGDEFTQALTVVEKVSVTHNRQQELCRCVFVPLIGKYGFRDA